MQALCEKKKQEIEAELLMMGLPKYQGLEREVAELKRSVTEREAEIVEMRERMEEKERLTTSVLDVAGSFSHRFAHTLEKES